MEKKNNLKMLRNNIIIKFLAFFIVFYSTFSYCFALQNKRIQLEGGVVKQSLNEVADNDSSSVVSLSNIENPSNFYYRISYYANFDEKSGFRILFAPLNISGSGNISDSVSYQNADFNENQETYYNYKFNSYRFTYIRNVFDNEKNSIKLGITGKIRDAAVSISQDSNIGSESNLGFVPLVYFDFQHKFNDKIKFEVETDFLASNMGRAIDFGISLVYNVNKNIDISCGYRFLEGGAWSDKVYTKAFINYYFLGLGIKF